MTRKSWIVRLVVASLLALHGGLLVWGVLGLAEFLGVVGIGLQNEAFPPGMQALHWLAILAGGGLFLAGYAMRWQQTASTMALVYTMMATLCAVQTTDLLTHDGRYIAMVAEYLAYLAILWFLFRSSAMRDRFAGGTGGRARTA